MSVLPSDLVIYGSVNMPAADAVTTGGAVDMTRRVDFSDISPTGTLDVVSSNAADTATQIKYGVRDATGAEQVVTSTLSGTSPFIGTQSAERLLYALLSNATSNGPTTPPAGTAATGDVALFSHTRVVSTHTAQSASNSTASTPALIRLQAGDVGSPTNPVLPGHIIRILNNTPAGAQFQLRRVVATAGYGTDFVAVNRDWTVIPTSATTYEVLQGMLFEILPAPVTSIVRAFARSASDIPTGVTRFYYEKVFIVNNNTGISLTGAQIQMVSATPTLPSGAQLDIALTNALNDSGTVTNRQTPPAVGVGSFTNNPTLPGSALNVPAPGNVPAGATPNTAGSQGIWVRLTLPAGSAAYKGSADLRTTGTTT